MSTVDQAVQALSELGLSQYEARCFVALGRLSRGTAKEISRVADVPRPRVYDTVERLHQRGLVEIQESEPRQYRAIETDAALELLEQDYADHLERANRALSDLEPSDPSTENGVWAVATHEVVVDRIVSLVEGADDEVHLLLAGDAGLEDAVLHELAAAGDRGVELLIEVPSDGVGDRLRERLPDATIAVSSTLGTAARVRQKWPGRLLMVDDEAVLASGLEEGELPDVVRETAVWTSGFDHGLAAWIRELLSDRRAIRDIDAGG